MRNITEKIQCDHHIEMQLLLEHLDKSLLNKEKKSLIMKNHWNKTICMLFISVVVLSCENNQRDFFFETGSEKIEFDSNNWWSIELEPSFCLVYCFYKTNINLLKFQFSGYSYFENGTFYLCETSNTNSCEAFFNFNEPLNSVEKLNDNTNIRFLFESNGVFFYEFDEAVSIDDFYFSNTSIWALSKEKGFIGVSYLERESCSFIKSVVLANFDFMEYQNLICKSFGTHSSLP